MAIYKNKASQKLAVLAWDTSADEAKTGDAAQITAEISKDGAASAASNDANPTELDATDHPGIYLFDLTQAETNADLICFSAVSSTANIRLEPLMIYTEPEIRKADLDTIKTQTVTCAAGVTVLASVGTADTSTAQTGDSYAIVNHADYGNAKLVRATTPANTLDVASSGEAGLDFNNINDAAAPKTLTNITVPTVSTLTGHTVQTGDSYAIVNHADYGNDKLVRSTIPANTLDVAATGETGLDFNNVKAATGATTLTNITVPTVTTVGTCTTNSDMRGTDSANTTTPPTVTQIRAEIDSNSTQLALIVADTNELQGDWTNGGRLDLILDELTTQGDTNEGKLDTADTVVDGIATQIGTAGDGLTSLPKTGYKLASDGLDSVAVTEPATAGSFNFREMVLAVYRYLFGKALVHKTSATEATHTLYKENGSTVLGTQALTDDGTDQTREEFNND